MKKSITVTAVALFVATAQLVSAQGFHQKQEAKRAASAAPQSVAGGAMLQTAVSMEEAFNSAVNELKRQGYILESVDKDAGQIMTAMVIKGGYSQTGTRVIVTFIKNDNDMTTVRVAVTEQKRKKALQAEPWSDPKVDMAASTTVSQTLIAPKLQAQN